MEVIPEEELLQQREYSFQLGQSMMVQDYVRKVEEEKKEVEKMEEKEEIGETERKKKMAEKVVGLMKEKEEKEEGSTLKQIQYASAYNRTFGSEGSKIRVYCHDEDKMSHLLDLPQLMDQEKNKIESENLLLLDNDTKFMVLGSDKRVYKYDITKGQVTDTIQPQGREVA